MGRRAAVLCLLVATGGCRGAARPAAAAPHASDRPNPPAPAGGAPASGIPARSPLTQGELATTDPAIAMGNLEAELAEGRRLCAGTAPSPDALANLVELLLAHGALVGRPAEYGEALARGEEAVKRGPRLALAYRARAAARARLHRFDAALADLARAAELGATGRDFEQSRAAILQAQGHLAEARTIRTRWASVLATFDSLFALATVDADEGKVDEAERGFIAAQQHLRDVSPFPLARLWLQEALMWMEAGRAARARELLEAAHARVPGDAAVTSHLAAALAATREPEPAVALLRPLVERSEDPEYAAQLADLLAEGGHHDAEVAALREKARAGFAALLSRYPEAYADHAARFFLGGGASAARSRALADGNLAVRKTEGAYALGIESHLAAADPTGACALAEAALAAYPRFPHLHVLGARAYAACGRTQQADAEIQASLRPPPR